MIRRDLLTGHGKPYLEHALCLNPCYEGGINGSEVAACILQDTAIGKNYASNKLNGARRLRDAIILEYQLQRAPGRDVSIPGWYALAENELGLHPAAPAWQMRKNMRKALLLNQALRILRFFMVNCMGFLIQWPS